MYYIPLYYITDVSMTYANWQTNFCKYLFTLFIPGDILHVNNVLDEVIERYNLYCKNKKEKQARTNDTKSNEHTQGSNSESLLDFAGVNASSGGGEVSTKSMDSSKNNAIDELGDIFSTGTAATHIAETLKPVSLMPTNTGEKMFWNI